MWRNRAGEAEDDENKTHVLSATEKLEWQGNQCRQCESVEKFF